MKPNMLSLKEKSIRILSFAFVMILFSQCKGPMGNDGMDGINYTKTILYDINPSKWSGDVNAYTTSISVPEITNDIYYSGAVLVYRLFETDPKSFNLLPYTYVDNDLTIYLDFDASIGSIKFTYKEVFNGVNDTPVQTAAMSFKVVIIKGISLATLKGMVDVNDYMAVTKLMNVK